MWWWLLYALLIFGGITIVLLIQRPQETLVRSTGGIGRNRISQQFGKLRHQESDPRF